LYPSIVLRYRIPGVGHPDRPALDTIAALAQGRHGLLSNPLIGQGLASSVGADFRVIHIYRFGTPAAINFVAAATSDEALPATERAMLEAIEELRAGHLDPALLERARRSLRLEWEQTRADRLELAFTIGHFQSMDAWKTLSEYMARRLDVSADDIARVARRYFVSSNRVIATTRSDPGKASSP
jgi:zinc protease